MVLVWGLKLVETIQNTIAVLVPTLYREKGKCEVELIL